LKVREQKTTTWYNTVQKNKHVAWL